MLKKLPHAIFAVSAALLVLAPTSLAATLDPGQITEYRQNCSGAQINLQQIQKHDAVARINRGRAYDSMLRQVSALNSRLAYNKIPSASEFTQITADMQARVESFREAYRTYDEQLIQAINVDCKQHTSEFHTSLTLARTHRAAVASQVTAIAQLITDYRNKLADYWASLPTDTINGVTTQ